MCSRTISVWIFCPWHTTLAQGKIFEYKQEQSNLTYVGLYIESLETVSGVCPMSNYKQLDDKLMSFTTVAIPVTIRKRPELQVSLLDCAKRWSSTYISNQLGPTSFQADYAQSFPAAQQLIWPQPLPKATRTMDSSWKFLYFDNVLLQLFVFVKNFYICSVDERDEKNDLELGSIPRFQLQSHVRNLVDIWVPRVVKITRNGWTLRSGT